MRNRDKKWSLIQWWRRIPARTKAVWLLNPVLWLILVGLYMAVKYPSQTYLELLPSSETSYSLNFVESEQAVCNDGSPLAYYAKSAGGDSSEPWLIYLEGGAACTTVAECQERAKLYPHLVSSKDYQSQVQLSGIFSDDPDLNTLFAKANTIFVPYCSSDHWLGGTRHVLADGSTLHFNGRGNVMSLIAELQNKPPLGYPSLSTSSSLLFVGQSAGGVGVVHLIATVSRNLPGLTVRGVLEGSYMIDRVGSVGEFSTDSLSHASDSSLVDFWQPSVDPDCAQARADDPLGCAGQTVMNYVNSPVFVIQDENDHFFIDRLSESEKERFAQVVQAKLATSSAAFISRKGYHSVLATPDLFTLEENGKSLLDTLGQWLE